MFNEPKRKYYRVQSGPCHEVLTRWKAAREALQDSYLEFAKSVGGTGYCAGHDDHVGNATAISAVIFLGELPKGWKARRWKSFSGDLRGKVTGWPDNRTIAGKDALKAIKALSLLPSSYGPCREIGFPSGLSYSGDDTVRGSASLGFWETLNVGWLQDTFYVSLPDEAAKRASLEADGYTVEGELWTPLPGMEEILREEMDLDFAREKAREAARAKAKELAE